MEPIDWKDILLHSDLVEYNRVVLPDSIGTSAIGYQLNSVRYGLVCADCAVEIWENDGDRPNAYPAGENEECIECGHKFVVGEDE